MCILILDVGIKIHALLDLLVIFFHEILNHGMEALSSMVGDHARVEEGVDDFRIVCPKSFGDVVHLEAEIDGCLGTDNLTPDAFVNKEVLLADNNFMIIDLQVGLDVGSNELKP